jgi:hypothetical protein
MAAPERFAEMPDSSCNAGAVHTWHSTVGLWPAQRLSVPAGTTALAAREPARMKMTPELTSA